MKKIPQIYLKCAIFGMLIGILIMFLEILMKKGSIPFEKLGLFLVCVPASISLSLNLNSEVWCRIIIVAYYNLLGIIFAWLIIHTRKLTITLFILFLIIAHFQSYLDWESFWDSVFKGHHFFRV